MSTGHYEGLPFKMEAHYATTFNKQQPIEDKDLSEQTGTEELVTSSHSCKFKHVFPKAEGRKIEVIRCTSGLKHFKMKILTNQITQKNSAREEGLHGFYLSKSLNSLNYR